MITRIELENFKGIRERVALDLKPITLLFGANSSGKSTVIHALHYALEVLKNHNLDVDRTTLGGESITLGGFRSLVHGHDFGRRITMLFEFDVNSSLADYTEGVSDIPPAYRGPPGPNLEGAALDDRVLSAWIRLEVGWSQSLGAPQVFAYEVGANGNRERPIVRIEAAASGQTAALLVRVDDGAFGATTEEEETELAQLAADAGLKVKDGLASLPAYQTSALPTWGRPLRMWLTDDLTPVAASLMEIRRVVSKLAVGLGELLVANLGRLLYIGPLRTVPPRDYRPPLTEDLARWAEGLGAWDALHRQGKPLRARTNRWMGRLRTGYQLESRIVREVDADTVEKLWQVLSALTFARDLADETGRLLARVAPKNRRASTDAAALGKLARAPKKQLGSWLDALRGGQAREDLVLVDERNGVVVSPSDVGVGISQVLPVVVAAVYRGERGAGAFVVVEQPELHIHPKLQVALADLFIEQSCKGTVSDHRFLLETHSEHILLRLLRRIREGADAERVESSRRGGIHAPRDRKGVRTPARGRRAGTHAVADAGTDKAAKPVLTPDMLSIVYVERAEDGSTKFVPLRVDRRGEFLDVWPDGFFEERDPELFG